MRFLVGFTNNVPNGHLSLSGFGGAMATEAAPNQRKALRFLGERLWQSESSRNIVEINIFVTHFYNKITVLIQFSTCSKSSRHAPLPISRQIIAVPLQNPYQNLTPSICCPSNIIPSFDPVTESQLLQNCYLLLAKRVDGSIFAPVKCKVHCRAGCRPLTKPFAYQ